jgi:hypothetical protein
MDAPLLLVGPQQMFPVVQVNPVPQAPFIQAPTAGAPPRHVGFMDVDEQHKLLMHEKPVPHAPLMHPPAACIPPGHTA